MKKLDKREKTMNLFLKDKKSIYAIADGKTFPIEEVKDEVFSSKMMGDGIAFELMDNKIYSPGNGIIQVVFPDGHAIGLKRKDGAEFLIHIGFNVCDLKGKGFYPKVKVGQKVKSGDLLVELSREELKEIDLTTVLIFMNFNPVKKKINSAVIANQTIVAEG